MSNSPWRASPILGVKEVRKAAEYYRDVFGFSLDPDDGIFQPPGSSEAVYAIVMRSDVWIHLQIRRSDNPAAPRPPIERDVYVYADDLDALHQEFIGRGATVLSAPGATPYGMREMVVEDLNGYRIAFGESR